MIAVVVPSLPGLFFMVCTSPLSAWPASPEATDRRIVFSPFRSYDGARSKLVPCGQCLSCRLTKAQNWATRIHHEASCFEENSFITLTYADEHMPRGGTLERAGYKRFLDRLVDHLGSTRHFSCGEYGTRTLRPHYHAILFGQGFSDRVLWQQSPMGDPLFRSPTLERLWPYGHCLIGAVTLTSAEYVARYSIKKATGDRAASALLRGDPATGECWSVEPEFLCMTRRPGIGEAWLNANWRDVFPSDFVVINGKKRAVPPFYDRKLGDLQRLALVAKRKRAARAHAANNTDRRLMTRTESRILKADRLKRDAEGV